LRARPAYRRTLAAIEDAKLDAAQIGHPAHEAIERIDLADQMSLAKTPDGGIARHRPDGRNAVRDQGGRGAHAGGRSRGLTTRVAAADDQHIELGIHRPSPPPARLVFTRAPQVKGAGP
jgi:hypothetical protein